MSIDKQTFRKYGSIINVDSFDGRKVIDQYGEVESVVMEKAHGAHFAFVTDGTSVWCAKRKSVLTPEDKFYDHQDLLARFEETVLKIYQIISADIPGITILQVEGELIGGLYSHPDVEGIDGPHIQRGVFYAPKYEFYAYDIYYETQSDQSGQSSQSSQSSQSGSFLNYDRALEIFESVDLLHAKPLARGSFAELCKHDNAFESVIPTDLGLPKIQGNIVEGIVIKPVDHVRMPTGSRVILKSKNSKFQETIAPKKTKTRPEMNIDSDVSAAIDSMVTMNRLDNVISKIGEVTMKQFGLMMKDLNQDVLKDFPSEYPEIHQGIDQKEWPLVKKYLNTKTAKLIKRYFATH